MTERSGSFAGKIPLVVGLATVIVVLDQVTKIAVVRDLAMYARVAVIPGFFDLTYVRNTGAAFSLMADQPAAFRVPFFLFVSSAAALALLWFIRSTPREDRVTLIAAALVLGGAVGNLIDRVLYGSVIDFLLVYWRDWHWPAFNVADSAITVGVVVLMLRSLTGDDPGRPEPKPVSAAPSAQGSRPGHAADELARDGSTRG